MSTCMHAIALVGLSTFFAFVLFPTQTEVLSDDRRDVRDKSAKALCELARPAVEMLSRKSEEIRKEFAPTFRHSAISFRSEADRSKAEKDGLSDVMRSFDTTVKQAVATLVRGDPQSSKHVYIFQAYVYPARGQGNSGRRWIGPPEGYTGEWVGWYESGKESHTYHFRNGQLHGVITTWYEDGQKLYEDDRYEDGVLKGTRSSWYPNGQLRYVWHMKDGELHGPCRAWDSKGNLVARFHHVRGAPSGRSLQWDEDGNLVVSGVYRDGKPWEGTFRDRSTVKPVIKRYSNGERVEAEE